jgi:hypothetical protein
VASLRPVHIVSAAVSSWRRPQELAVRACYHGVKNYIRSLHYTSSTAQHNLYIFFLFPLTALFVSPTYLIPHNTALPISFCSLRPFYHSTHLFTYSAADNSGAMADCAQ